MRHNNDIITQREITLSEKLYYYKRYLKIHLKYYWDLYITKKYDNVPGHKYINKSLKKQEYDKLIQELYGNKYVDCKYKEEDAQMKIKRWIAAVIDQILLNPYGGGKTVICDAGANAGYLMKAFWELGYEVYGFDILEDKSTIINSENDVIREHYYLGSILDIPQFPQKIDVLTCIDVFEHIPINYINQMVEQLLLVSPKYFVLGISQDAISDGHITLKGLKWWTGKFSGYRIMRELTPILNKLLTPEQEHYQNTGIPRNGWNNVPGFVFMEKIDQ